MDLQFLIVTGAGLLLMGIILIPAELQIYQDRKGEQDHPYAKRDYHWSRKLLNHLLTFGFSLLVLYIILTEPSILDSLLHALSLK